MVFSKTRSVSCSIVLVAILVLAIPSISFFNPVAGQNSTDGEHEHGPEGHTPPEVASDGPTVRDPELVVETVFEGIDFPTGMAFLGSDDILVLEKNNGTVKRIIDGEMQEEPLLDVAVANNDERGMLGIAIVNDTSDSQTPVTYVFLYFTESGGGADGDDWREGIEPAGNRLYRYELQGDRLVNSELILDLPAIPGPRYNGGPIVVGQDGLIYLTIGDVEGHATQAQNFENGIEPDGTSGILRMDIDGEAVDPVLGTEEMLQYYFAYGIRNSFGMDFDPVTGKLWDTENGPASWDEINLVEPGFNSGWRDIQGPVSVSGQSISDLVDFGGDGEYSDPEFGWVEPVGPTALKFFDSDSLGDQYENDMFVGEVNNGFLFRFELAGDRTSLELDGELADKAANSPVENQPIIFGEGFGGITDIDVGPDGHLYVLSFHENGGTIFRIAPEEAMDDSGTITADDEEDQKVSLIVESVNLDGQHIEGLYTEIKQDGELLEKGFTPLIYDDADVGSRYEITVADFENYRFSHWQDRGEERTVIVVPDSNEDEVTLVAYYEVTATTVNDDGEDRNERILRLLDSDDNCMGEKETQKFVKALGKILRNMDDIKEVEAVEKHLNRIFEKIERC